MLLLLLSYTLHLVLPAVVSLRYTSYTRNGKKIVNSSLLLSGNQLHPYSSGSLGV
mgnify:CR=1 FL=1